MPPREYKIRDTVTGGSVLASGAQPPVSVVNFFRWDKVEPCDGISYKIEPCDCTSYHIEPCNFVFV